MAGYDKYLMHEMIICQEDEASPTLVLNMDLKLHREYEGEFEHGLKFK